MPVTASYKLDQKSRVSCRRRQHGGVDPAELSDEELEQPEPPEDEAKPMRSGLLARRARRKAEISYWSFSKVDGVDIADIAVVVACCLLFVVCCFFFFFGGGLFNNARAKRRLLREVLFRRLPRQRRRVGSRGQGTHTFWVRWLEPARSWGEKRSPTFEPNIPSSGRLPRQLVLKDFLFADEQISTGSISARPSRFFDRICHQSRFTCTRPETHVLLELLRYEDYYHASPSLRGERQRAKGLLLSAVAWRNWSRDITIDSSGRFCISNIRI